MKDGRIQEVNGNRSGAPNAVYKKALKRYEEALSELLADRSGEKNNKGCEKGLRNNYEKSI